VLREMSRSRQSKSALLIKPNLAAQALVKLFYMFSKYLRRIPRSLVSAVPLGVLLLP